MCLCSSPHHTPMLERGSPCDLHMCPRSMEMCNVILRVLESGSKTQPVRPVIAATSTSTGVTESVFFPRVTNYPAYVDNCSLTDVLPREWAWEQPQTTATASSSSSSSSSSTSSASSSSAASMPLRTRSACDCTVCYSCAVLPS